jgi:hypothetical protein
MSLSTLPYSTELSGAQNKSSQRCNQTITLFFCLCLIFVDVEYYVSPPVIHRGPQKVLRIRCSLIRISSNQKFDQRPGFGSGSWTLEVHS